jgi:hypothetical protein
MLHRVENALLVSIGPNVSHAVRADLIPHSVIDVPRIDHISGRWPDALSANLTVWEVMQTPYGPRPGTPSPQTFTFDVASASWKFAPPVWTSPSASPASRRTGTTMPALPKGVQPGPFHVTDAGTMLQLARVPTHAFWQRLYRLTSDGWELVELPLSPHALMQLAWMDGDIWLTVLADDANGQRYTALCHAPDPSRTR